MDDGPASADSGLNPLVYRFCRFATRSYLRIYNRMSVEGRENAPAEGPVLAVCNHISNLDPIIAATCSPRLMHFFAKSELWRFKPVGALITALGAFPVRRGESDRAAWAKSIELLRAGQMLVVFPEGTRSKTGELTEFQQGAARMALSVPGTRVLPMRIRGSDNSLGRKGGLPRPSKITVKVGEPFDPADILPPGGEKKSLYRALTGEMYSRVSSLG